MNTYTRLFTAAALAAAILVPGLARADVTTTYPAWNCRADARTRDGSAYLDRTTTAGELKALQSSLVICPIPRKTSAPGITNDKFKSATVPIKSSGALVSCKVNVWRASIASPSDPNRIKAWEDTSTATNDPILIAATEAQPSPVQFWATGDSWFYMDMTCSLPAGTSLKDYTIVEGGTDQPRYRIYPAYATCTPNPSNDIPWQYRDAAPPVSDAVGGYLLGQASGSKFAMDCPVPYDRVVEFSFGRPNNAMYRIGCNLDNSDLSNMYWSYVGISTPGSWPSVVPRPPDYHVLSTPIPHPGENANVSPHKLTCGVNAGQGDGKLISYRTGPTPDHPSTWTVTAVNMPAASGLQAAIDYDPATRFTSGATAAANMALKINMGTSRVVQQVTFDSGTSNGDWARGYQILVSTDGTSWTEVYSGTGTGPHISARFAEQWVKHIQIKLTSGFPNWWSIHELYVY